MRLFHREQRYNYAISINAKRNAMPIILTPIQKAFESLNKGLKRSLAEPNDLEVRDGCIQRFEYTYELCIKFLKRYLEEESSSPENIDQMNFKDLLRISAEMGLIKEVNSWFAFREARNNTSHAYNEIKAKEVFNVIPAFVKEVEYFIVELEKRVKKG
jgi:nucleotidyltransferase substrate binding protein (TIGR01987 family)